MLLCLLQDLKDIIAHVKPHALIGLSAQGGAWKEEDIQVSFLRDWVRIPALQGSEGSH